MKTQVEFRSSKFPLYEGEQEQINHGPWGKRLAEYSMGNYPLTRLTEAMQQILSADPKSKKWYGKGRPSHELPFREV